MSNSDRIAVLQTRLAAVQAAINGTLDRNADSYSTEIQSVKSLSMTELVALESRTINEIARLTRGSRFGKVGFKRVC